MKTESKQLAMPDASKIPCAQDCGETGRFLVRRSCPKYLWGRCVEKYFMLNSNGLQPTLSEERLQVYFLETVQALNVGKSFLSFQTFKPNFLALLEFCDTTSSYLLIYSQNLRFISTKKRKLMLAILILDHAFTHSVGSEKVNSACTQLTN